MRDLATRGELTVLMITHKFREVMAYADDVTVLRKGKLVGTSAVADTSRDELAAWMMSGETGNVDDPELARTPAERRPLKADSPVRLALAKLNVIDDRGHMAVRDISLSVRSGEILGIAGVSGNGQKELIEALVGQRRVQSGEMRMLGEPYRATREEMTRLRVFALPEEPLRNACVANMSIAENLALRDFDRAPMKRHGWRLDRRAMRERAERRIAEFNVRPPVPARAIGTLSGGNVQRAVLARELGQAVDVLIVANPVFGLDFASVADIHARILAARDAGAAVLLVSEDLDELLELADRIAVIAEGRLVHETPASGADRVALGRHMAGHVESATRDAAEPLTVHA
jgi:simple sugar transport system ATP-binding protein